MQEARRTSEPIQSHQATDRLLAFLGLGFNPFSMAINQKSYYETAATKRIMELIVYGTETRKGFLMLSGVVGAGKSSLLLRLLARLKSRGMVTAMVVNSLMDKKELLENICADFGLRHRPGLNNSHLLIVLHTFFLHQHKKGHNCVILVDEAHHLGYEALESLRMLANLKTDGVKLVQIVICGQPELRERLQSRQLRQFASRISIATDLPELTKSETHGYVEFKLAQAGSQIRPSTKALDLLWNASQGNPRTVNLLMERCLYAMVARGRDVIDGQTMLAAIQDLEYCRSGPDPKTASLPKKRWNLGRLFGISGMAGFAGLGSILLFISAILLGWFIGQGGLQSILSDRFDTSGPAMAMESDKSLPAPDHSPASSGYFVTVDLLRHQDAANQKADMIKDIGLDACVLRHLSNQGTFYTLKLGRGLNEAQVQAVRNHYQQYFTDIVYTEPVNPENSAREQIYCAS